MEDMQSQIFQKDMELQIVQQEYEKIKKVQDEELKKLKKKKVIKKDSIFDGLSNNLNIQTGDFIDMNNPSGRGIDGSDFSIKQDKSMFDATHQRDNSKSTVDNFDIKKEPVISIQIKKDDFPIKIEEDFVAEKEEMKVEVKPAEVKPIAKPA